MQLPEKCAPIVQIAGDPVCQRHTKYTDSLTCLVCTRTSILSLARSEQTRSTSTSRRGAMGAQEEGRGNPAAPIDVVRSEARAVAFEAAAVLLEERAQCDLYGRCEARGEEVGGQLGVEREDLVAPAGRQLDAVLGIEVGPRAGAQQAERGRLRGRRAHRRRGLLGLAVLGAMRALLQRAPLGDRLEALEHETCAVAVPDEQCWRADPRLQVVQ